MASIEIRELRTAEEILPCEELQAKTWDMPDGVEIVPMHQLYTAVKYGGVIVGAYDQERLVGMAYGFPGLYRGEVVLCSHMNAVLPEYRGHGLGYRLKLAQRVAALAKGYSVMHWTYDPLELVNGNLNIKKLGGISQTYVRNMYGEMRDGLNTGLPSDRLVVAWELNSPRVLTALTQGHAPAPDRSACAAYDGTALPAGGGPLALTLPRSFQAIKKESAEAGRTWRLKAREAFEKAFAAGYWLTGADADGYIFTK